MPTFGSANKHSLPVTFAFSYNGEATTWGSRLYSIGDITNEADPVNNNLRISDMRVSFIDTDGALWGSLGNGTTAFNKELSGTVFIGGSVGAVSDALGIRYKKVSNTGAYTNTFFTGKIRELSKKEGIVSMSAQNLMNLLPLLKWQFQVNDYDNFAQGSFYTKYSFCVPKPVLDITWGNLVTHAGFNKENSSADFYGYVTESGIPVGYSSGVTGIYDTSAGTGIDDTLLAPDRFLNDQFYRDYQPLKFKGTFFGTLIGTITSGTQAQEYGFTNLVEAEGVKASGAYVINKMRFEWPSGTADSSLPTFNYRAVLRLAGDPTAILRHLLFGRMVTSYFDETLNMGTETFYEAAGVTAFKYYNQIINPDDEKVLPYITDLLDTESALFHVTSANQFGFQPYGPKNLSADLESIGTAEISDSAYSNDANDSYNRIELNYNYIFEKDQFDSKTYGTLPDWEITKDVPLILDSHWIANGNQANLTIKRQLARYKNTFPKVTFTAPLKHVDKEIGTLIKISDSNSGVTDKIVQVTGYRKSFGNDNKIDFSGYDGEALFSKRGYAIWEGDDDLTAVVSGTSTSGWGTTISGVGTCLGINESLFGTQFVWW